MTEVVRASFLCAGPADAPHRVADDVALAIEIIEQTRRRGHASLATRVDQLPGIEPALKLVTPPSNLGMSHGEQIGVRSHAQESQASTDIAPIRRSRASAGQRLKPGLYQRKHTGGSFLHLFIQ